MLKVSVVTPSYNQAKYLRQTIESVLSQGYPNLEYIIMDGGSSDGSVDIIREYQKHLAFWTSGKDGGQTQAVNIGLRRCTGDIVTWLNSDDYFEPGALRAAVDAFSATDAGVVYGDYTLVTETGKPFLVRREIPFDYNILLFGVNIIGQPSAYFKRDMLLKHGYLDETLQYMMDYEYWLRLASRGVNFHHINKMLSYCRYHAASKTVSQTDKFDQETQAVRCRYSGETRPGVLRRRNILARVRRQWIKLLHRGTVDYLGGPLRLLAYTWRK